MKEVLKRLALRGLTAPPIYRLLRMRALAGNPTTILCYHTLRPDVDSLDAWVVLRLSEFRAQIELLRKNYDIVSLDAALTLPADGPRPRVVLTFDDGEQGLYNYLLPIIAAENLPVTVYVATAQIETGVPYWFDRVMNALQGVGTTRIDLSAQELGTWTVGPARGRPRWSQIGPILEALKAAPPMERDELADDIVAQAGSGAEIVTPLRPMTLVQLKELAKSPHVTIGAHSHGHELLDQISLSEARASISRSRELLQDWTGQPVCHFAYPNGNYTPDLMTVLADLGFASATILEDRLVPAGTTELALTRIGVGRYDSLSRFQLRLVEI